MITAPIGHAERLILLLTAFAEGPDVMSVKELAERLGLPQSSTHRLLESLVATGLIGRAPHRKYRIGTELFRLAAIVEDRFELVATARPIMRQVVGGVAHAIGNALMERIVFDGEAQPLTTNFGEYLLPLATDVPRIEIIHLETPSPLNPLGMKGAGEGGTIPTIAAILNAVNNALAPLGAVLREVPILPHRVLEAVNEATLRGTT